MRILTFISTALFVWGITFAIDTSAHAADVPCLFKSEGERVELTILVDEKVIGSETLARAETTTIAVPEGPFTVLSKVYNPNLETMGDIRAVSHTKACKPAQPISVPLFPSDQ